MFLSLKSIYKIAMCVYYKHIKHDLIRDSDNDMIIHNYFGLIDFLTDFTSDKKLVQCWGFSDEQC